MGQVERGSIEFAFFEQDVVGVVFREAIGGTSQTMIAERETAG